jgi:tetratricopeptide (TPR) repeat protein
MSKLYENDPLYRAAVDAAEEGRHKESIELWTELISRDPRKAPFYWCLGHEYLETGSFNAAIDAFTTAIGLNERSGVAWNGLGTAYEELGRYEQARDAYERAVQYDPKVYNYVLLAAILTKLNRFDDAIRHCQNALQINPNYEEAYLNLGLAYRGNRFYSEAIEALNRAIELAPDYASAYAGLALVYESMGDDELASAYRDRSANHMARCPPRMRRSYGHLERFGR